MNVLVDKSAEYPSAVVKLLIILVTRILELVAIVLGA